MVGYGKIHRMPNGPVIRIALQFVINYEEVPRTTLFCMVFGLSRSIRTGGSTAIARRPPYGAWSRL